MYGPPHLRCLSVYGLATALLVCSLTLSTAGQSPTVKKSATLEVLSAEYVRDSDTIKVELINRGKQAVTAYGIDISVLSDGRVLNQSGRASDLLNAVVSVQCGAASNDILATLGPGEIRTDSQPANVDKAQLTTPQPEIRVNVVGILWADGKVEGDPKNPSGLLVMNRMQKQREKDASDEAKVIAILDEHEGDTDIHQRIRSVSDAVAALASAPSGETENATPARSNGFSDVRSPVFANFLTNLQMSYSSPAPKETFEAVTSFLVCTHKERVAALRQPGASEAKLH